MRFERTDGPIPLAETDRGCIFASIFAGPETIMSYGGSATRKMLEIVAPSGAAKLTYEQAIALRDWLNENVD